MTRERIDTLCERGILALVLALLCFGPLATGAVNAHEFLIVQTLSLGVLCLWLVRIWGGTPRRLLWPPVCWPILGFAIYAVIRYSTAEIEYVARWELLRVLVYAGLFYAVLNNLHRSESQSLVAKAVIGVGLFVAAVAIWQFLARTDKVPSLGALIESWLFAHKTWYIERVYVARASGTYVNPNHLAGLLELLLPLALAYTLIGRESALGRILLGYAGLVLLTGIGMTVSRGAWLATALVAVLFFAILVIRNRQRLAPVLVMFFIVAGCLFLIVQTEYFQRRLRDTFTGQVEQDTRMLLWGATVQMCRDHFWIGVGPGHYDHRFREYRPEEIQLRPYHAHNEFLNLMADWGVVGLALVLWALACIAIGGWKTWQELRRADQGLAVQQSNRLAFFLGSSLGLLAVLLHSAVDFNMQIPANAILVFCLLAMMSSQLRHASERCWVANGPGMKCLISLALVLCAGYFGAQGWRLAREYWWLTQAGDQAWHSMGEIAANQRAHGIEPRNSETTYQIGEAFLTHSKQGGEDNAELATNAITWFEAGMASNPYDQRNYTGAGWCWDWLALRQDELVGLHQVAERNFMIAETLDPKGYGTIKDIGYHFVQTRNYAAARTWFERSLRLQRRDNDTSLTYLPFCNARLVEAATNQFSIPVP